MTPDPWTDANKTEREMTIALIALLVRQLGGTVDVSDVELERHLGYDVICHPHDGRREYRVERK